MKEIRFPYGKSHIIYNVGDDEKVTVLESEINSYVPQTDGVGLVREAMSSPVGSPTLADLSRGKKNIVIIASDHTRPVPSKIIMPMMLDEIRSTSPDADITILIATGCHRGTTTAELVSKFGEDIVAREKIIVHDCDDRENLVSIGTLPSGGACVVNRIAVEADLLVAEGFIEPHFFAGFSGGRKSVLPGVAARETVLANHCSEFIAHACARTGILEGNPIHTDMLWAAEKAGLAYIVNVVLNEKKEVIFAVAGDPCKAHAAGVSFLREKCGVSAEPSDIVITSNGGYPLDQNMYQAVKGMTAAESAIKEGGVIIMIAASEDGVGGDHFYRQLTDECGIHRTMEIFLGRTRGETVPDQWQTQIMLRILMYARVIYVSEMPDDTVSAMHMIPAHSVNEAMSLAKNILGRDVVTVTAIPDGVSVIVEK